MFLANKYTKYYFQIIFKRKILQPIKKSKEIYTENHHIIPRSLKGDNSKSNFVRLTAREHFICHWLLTKMVENKKHKLSMSYSFMRMNVNTPNKFSQKYYNSLAYENSKKLYSISRLGKKPSDYNLKRLREVNTNKIVSNETRKKLSESQLGEKSFWFGKTMSKEANEKNRQSQLKKISIIKDGKIKILGKKERNNLQLYFDNGWILLENSLTKASRRRLMIKDGIQKNIKVKNIKVKNIIEFLLNGWKFKENRKKDNFYFHSKAKEINPNYESGIIKVEKIKTPKVKKSRLWTEERKQKQSERNKKLGIKPPSRLGSKLTEEHKKIISEFSSKRNINYKHSEEAKQKMKQSHLGKKQTPQHIEKVVKAKKLKKAQKLIQENCCYEEYFYNDFVYQS